MVLLEEARSSAVGSRSSVDARTLVRRGAQVRAGARWLRRARRPLAPTARTCSGGRVAALVLRPGASACHVAAACGAPTAPRRNALRRGEHAAVRPCDPPAQRTQRACRRAVLLVRCHPIPAPIPAPIPPCTCPHRSRRLMLRVQTMRGIRTAHPPTTRPIASALQPAARRLDSGQRSALESLEEPRRRALLRPGPDAVLETLLETAQQAPSPPGTAAVDRLRGEAAGGASGALAEEWQLLIETMLREEEAAVRDPGRAPAGAAASPHAHCVPTALSHASRASSCARARSCAWAPTAALPPPTSLSQQLGRLRETELRASCARVHSIARAWLAELGVLASWPAFELHAWAELSGAERDAVAQSGLLAPPPPPPPPGGGGLSASAASAHETVATRETAASPPRPIATLTLSTWVDREMRRMLRGGGTGGTGSVSGEITQPPSLTAIEWDACMSRPGSSQCSSIFGSRPTSPELGSRPTSRSGGSRPTSRSGSQRLRGVAVARHPPRRPRRRRAACGEWHLPAPSLASGSPPVKTGMSASVGASMGAGMGAGAGMSVSASVPDIHVCTAGGAAAHAGPTAEPMVQSEQLFPETGCEGEGGAGLRRWRARRGARDCGGGRWRRRVADLWHRRPRRSAARTTSEAVDIAAHDSDEARAPRRAERTRVESRDGEPRASGTTAADGRRAAHQQHLLRQQSQFCVDVPAAAGPAIGAAARRRLHPLPRAQESLVVGPRATAERPALPRSRLPGPDDKESMLPVLSSALAERRRHPREHVESWVQPATHARTQSQIQSRARLRARTRPQTHPAALALALVHRRRRPCPGTPGFESELLFGAASLSVGLDGAVGAPVASGAGPATAAAPCGAHCPSLHTPHSPGPFVWASLHEGAHAAVLSLWTRARGVFASVRWVRTWSSRDVEAICAALTSAWSSHRESASSAPQ